MKDIDWEMTAMAMQALPHLKQQWVSKLATIQDQYVEVETWNSIKMSLLSMCDRR